MRQQLARAFQISQWVGVGMGASLTLLWSVFSNYLSGEGSRWIPWIVLVTVGFVIDASGAVSGVSNAGSSMPDSGVVNCVVRSFGGLSFPQPEGGVVRVTYPISFSPG